MGYENHLQSNLVPVKIRAIQGHLKAALDKAGGFFANAVQVYCAPNVRCERKAAFAGVPICLMSEVYRTMWSHWKGIVKHGLLPGGGDTVNSGPADVYLSDKRLGADAYRFGRRGKCPVEVKVALAQAVEADVIFSRSSMEGIMTAPYIISIMEEDKMLWNRAGSNIEPSSWEKAVSGSPKAEIRLVARDDSDLGDEDDTSTGQPDAPQATPRSATNKHAPEDNERDDQPPARVRRAFIAPKNAEPCTGDCPICMVDFVSGQVTCTTMATNRFPSMSQVPPSSSQTDAPRCWRNA